jgi:hypothetical protein
VEIEVRLRPGSRHDDDTGSRLPSSLVIGFGHHRPARSLLRRPSLTAPNTIASCVLSEPVMWISSIDGCWQR